MGTNEKLYKSNNKKNMIQMQRKQPNVAGSGVVTVPA
jgi:hypothetical protein